ncbi:MAG TPA: hypothetical protein VIU15_31225 [Streptomyces sp.]
MTLPLPLPRSGRPATAPPPISNIPEQSLPFEGRDEQIAHLMKLFSQYGHVLLHDADSGEGFGKTQMAIAFCKQFTRRYTVAWWFECSGETDNERLAARIEQQYHELRELRAKTLGEPETRPDSKWLFVYDDVFDPDRIYEHFVPGGGHRLVTSRARGLTWGENRLALGGLSPTVAEALLLKQTDGLSPEQAERIARHVGGRPDKLLTAAESVFQIGYEGYTAQLEPSALDTPPRGIQLPGPGSLLDQTDKRTLIEALLNSPANRSRDAFDLWVESIRMAIAPLELTPLSDSGTARNRIVAIVNFALSRPTSTVLSALAGAVEELGGADDEEARLVRFLADKAARKTKASHNGRR